MGWGIRVAKLLLPLINRILDHQADRKALLEQASDFKISFDLPETSPDEIFPLFTVKKKGVILGYLSAEMPDPVSDNNYLFIRQMSVRTGHEGKGNGRFLLNEAKDFIGRASLVSGESWIKNRCKCSSLCVRAFFE